MGRGSGDGVNFSPRSPLGMGILEMADVLAGLRSRSMRRGTLGGEEGVEEEDFEGSVTGGSLVGRWTLDVVEARRRVGVR